MAWFLFVGDMLVMLFMVLLVTWVSTAESKSRLDFSARIPLDDDLLPDMNVAAGEVNNG